MFEYKNIYNNFRKVGRRTKKFLQDVILLSVASFGISNFVGSLIPRTNRRFVFIVIQFGAEISVKNLILFLKIGILPTIFVLISIQQYFNGICLDYHFQNI